MALIGPDEEHAPLRVAERVLDGAQRLPGNFEGTTTLRGTFGGIPADVALGQFEESRDLYWCVRIHRPTLGVIVHCSPPAIWDQGKGLTGWPEFDARYSVNGAPRVLLRPLMTRDLCDRLVACQAELHFRDGMVETLSSGAHDEARVRAILEAATLAWKTLPEAIRAAGLEGWLQQHGTLASHPEVAKTRRRPMMWLVGSLGCAVIITLAVIVAALWVAARAIGH